MSIIAAHDNKTEVTGLTKDNSYHTVDLSSFVQNSDCVGVLLQFVNTNLAIFKDISYRTTYNKLSKDMRIVANSHQIILAKTVVDPVPYIDLKIQDSNIDVYILAEYIGDGVVLRDSDVWLEHQPGGGDWFTVTVTPLGSDSYADIEAVLVYGKTTSGPSTFGLRALGSTEGTHLLLQSQIFALPVQTNTNGQYQVYIPAAVCGPLVVWAIEIGYIKKNYGFASIFDPENIEIATNTDWGDYSLASTVEQYATHAVTRLVFAGIGRDVCGVRAKGSANSSDSLVANIWAVYWASLDSNRVLQYINEGSASGTLLWDVWGYLEGSPPPEPEPEPEEHVPELVSISDRFIVSLGAIMLEVLNIPEVYDGDFVVSRLQNPLFGFGVVNTENSPLTSAISPLISGRLITINSSDLDGDDGLILMIFGY